MSKVDRRANGEYVWTGDYEWGATYTHRAAGLAATRYNVEREAYVNAVCGIRINHGVIAYPAITMLPMPLFFGEGAPL